MKSLRGLFCLGLVLATGYGGGAQGQGVGAGEGIDAQTRAADARLKQPVTFDADRMYLGEVLEKVSALTGVSVSLPAEDLGSGIPITCHVKNLPLADFMNGLWSLVGYPQAAWQIILDAHQKVRSYKFLPTPASRSLSLRLLQETDHYAMDLTALLVKMSSMTLEQRRAHLPEMVRAMMLEDDTIPMLYVSDARYWALLHAYETLLTPEQKELVRKGETISVPFSKLDAAGQEQLRAPAGNNRSINVGAPGEEANVPDTIRFSWTNYSLDHRKRLVRDLTIGVGNTRSFLSRTYMAGLEEHALNQTYKEWILPGELDHAEAEKQVVSVLPDAPKIPKEQPEGVFIPAPPQTRPSVPFTSFMQVVAEGQSASYIAIVPDTMDSSMVIPGGKTGRQCLDELWARGRLMHKWHDNVLLLNYPLWFAGDDAQYPYAVVKQLRERKRSHAGKPITFQELAGDSAALSNVQIRRLLKEFPQLDAAMVNRPILGFYRKYPGILSEAGMATTPEMIAALKEARLMPALLENDTLEKLRILEASPAQPNVGKSLYSVQFQTVQRKEWRELINLSLLPDTPAPH